MTRALLHSRHSKLTALLVTTIIILLLPLLAWGQDSTPNRGFQPGGSFALSDIETVDTSSGNVMLNLALGKLSPGRGGMSGQLNLHYNTKLYDSRTEYYEDWDHMVFGQPQIIIRNVLMTSDQGGWHYGSGYQIQLIDRMYQFPPEIAPQYPDQATIYHYKVKVAFPDGSVREFFPRVGSTIDQGYSDIRPDGYQSRYNGAYVSDVPYFTNNVTYYTFDGSYIRLDVQHDSDANWWNNPWTLYFPDGTKVTNFGTRITDRNGNYVEWSADKDLYCTLNGKTKSYCTPESYKGQSPALYRNRGDGTFENVTKAAGLLDPANKMLGVALLDYDSDGWLDLFAANDTQPNRLYRNKTDGTFTGSTNLIGATIGSVESGGTGAAVTRRRTRALRAGTGAPG